MTLLFGLKKSLSAYSYSDKQTEKAINKIYKLKNYITDGTAASDKGCPECGSDGLIYLEGCLTCRDCGYSKCG